MLNDDGLIDIKNRSVVNFDALRALFKHGSSDCFIKLFLKYPPYFMLYTLKRVCNTVQTPLRSKQVSF